MAGLERGCLYSLRVNAMNLSAWRGGSCERWMGKVIHRSHRCDLSSFQLRLRRPEHFLNEDFSIPVAFHIIIEKAKKRPVVKREFTRSNPLHLKPKDGQRPSLTRLSA